MLHHPDSFHSPNILIPGLTAPKNGDEDVRRWLVYSYPGMGLGLGLRLALVFFTPKMGKPNKIRHKTGKTGWTVRNKILPRNYTK